MNFDLEKNLLDWKKQLRSNSAFDDGDIKEYELHLRDEISHLIDEGFSEEEAFAKAIQNFGETNKLASEIKRVSTSKNLGSINRSVEVSVLNLLPNYLKISARNMFRNKSYTFINILSVCLGIVVCTMILQYYFFETNQDTFHENSERIYRVNVDSYNSQGSLNFRTALNFPGLVTVLEEEANYIEAATSITGLGTIFQKDENVIQENNLYFVNGASVFDVFSFEILNGDPSDLDIPATMFISDSLAAKYFGDENPVGSDIEIIDAAGEWSEFEVRGVYKSIPALSHVQADAFVYGKDIVRINVDNGVFGSIPYDDIIWRLRNNYTYLKASASATPEVITEELRVIQEKYRQPFDLRQGISSQFSIQPISEIHLTQDILNEPVPVADMQSLNLILLIGIAALLIGWVNYINLATARSINRAREIGIRKVLGSSKVQLIAQFVFESLLVNLIAVLCSIVVLYFFIPKFHEILNQDVFDYLASFGSKWIIFGVCLLGGMLLSGLYPALIFSQFKPISTLKGAFKNSTKGIVLRKFLVSMQFSLSLFLLISIFVVFNQLQHLRTIDKGMNIEQTYIISPPTFLEGNPLDRFELFKHELEQIPGISKVTNSTVVPGTNGFSTVMGEKVLKEGGEERIRMNYTRIQHDYFDHYEITLLEGRFFEEERSGQENGAILNEAAVQQLGFSDPQSALNQEIFISIGDTLEVTGIVKNYAQQSLQLDYLPIVFVIPAANGYTSGMGPTSLKITSPNVEPVVSEIQDIFQQQFPGDIFNGYFLDDQFDQLYANEDRFGIIFSSFTLISVLITILGLIGLSSFMIGQKRKEIGIRKVLGSSTIQILTLILNDYLKLVLLSSVISIPLAIWWYLNWLQNFPFKFSPGVVTILIPLLVLIGITIFAIINQSLRAALVKPVSSLRTE